MDEYLDSLDQAPRAALSAVIEAARQQLPGLEQGRSYGMPVLLYRGYPLLAAVARARHLAIYPFSGSVVAAVAGRLGNHPHSKGAIRFSVESPLPPALVRDIVAARAAEIDLHSTNSATTG